ncbi:Glycosyl hydrolases family 18 [Vibrio aerogenes CECT 7868]|uniref:chitinase n=1 Tax=Vibrio aerogenes CECT 7868 TaxID=1216006 RepID=A0A1M5VNK9_9VIBR|nr:glycosyl hydrolase family 18 protein [Vibrio aerogenes]SHH76817.1 Glycosyl hydrolases family 18 [Vibrio aerogenes CECT 7868]
MSKQSVVGYFNGSVTQQEIETKAKDYDVVIFAFWVSPQEGASGAAASAAGNPALIDYVKQQGKRCLLSVGGSTFKPQTDDLSSAQAFGTGAAEFALQHGFDGVDFDIENIQLNSTSLAWLAKATNACLSVSGAENLSISHAPQGPYFTGPGGYAALESATQGRIDAYYIQYYNQGTWAYQSYENYDSMFATTYNDSGRDYANPTSITSISQQQGIPAEKLYVGKPVSTKDLDGTGYLSPEDLTAILKQAKAAGIGFGGIMGWCIDSDTDGSWGAAMKAALQD